MTLTVLPYGPAALLVETGELPPAPIAQAIALLEGVIDAVPGAGTVLVTFEAGNLSEREAIHSFTSRIRQLDLTLEDEPGLESGEVAVPVHYDGADLEIIAERTGLSTTAVIDAHTGGAYRVAFMGFAPGFGYLDGLPEVLHLPRLETPRTRVPRGAVAIAGPYSAVYPQPSPGGWLLLGRTELDLFDVAAEPPALLRPGQKVRFEPV